MKNTLPFLCLLLASGCGCKDISCPSDSVEVFKKYAPPSILEYHSGATSIDFKASMAMGITPASVPARKANEGFVRVCKPTQNCYETLNWEAYAISNADRIRLELAMQVVTPAYDQATVLFPQGTVEVNEDSYAFRFIGSLESPQAARTTADTTIRNRLFSTVLQFETSPSNTVSRFYLGERAGIIGYTLRRTGETFWRTDL